MLMLLLTVLAVSERFSKFLFGFVILSMNDFGFGLMTLPKGVSCQSKLTPFHTAASHRL
jgi:hypothetical protein